MVEGARVADPLEAEGLATPATRHRWPFAARMQRLLIGLMFLGFVLIAQSASARLFRLGLWVLVSAAFLQFAFGNIPPTAGWRKSLGLLIVTAAITGFVFWLGVRLTPTLVGLGR